MTDFFKYPSIPHLISNGGVTRKDKIFSTPDRLKFLQNNLVIEEKLDGANIGISNHTDGSVKVQNRGSILSQPYSGQFSRLSSWLAIHKSQIEIALKGNVILFGEWCAAKHSIEYDFLPDLFVLFDVFDLEMHAFWSVARRDKLATFSGLKIPPKLDLQSQDIQEILRFVHEAKSSFSNSFSTSIRIMLELNITTLSGTLVKSNLTSALFILPLDIIISSLLY